MSELFCNVPEHEKLPKKPSNQQKPTTSKRITEQQLEELAHKHNISVQGLKAVISVECRGRGFFKNGKPKILFERHVFYDQLGEIDWFTMRDRFAKTHPSICNEDAGGYRSHKRSQYTRLQVASTLIDSDELRKVALMSCSWGLGQVMGYHYDKLGYDSIDDFVEKMYESEYQQLEAMIRYLEHFNLIDHLNKQNWHEFARGYNGKNYRKNNYAEKLASAFKLYSA